MILRPENVVLLELVAPAAVAVLDTATWILVDLIEPLRIVRFSTSELATTVALVAVSLIVIIVCTLPEPPNEPSDIPVEFVRVVGVGLQSDPTGAVGPMMFLFVLVTVVA